MEEKQDNHCVQWIIAAKVKVLADITLELKQLWLPEKRFSKKEVKTVDRLCI